MSGNKTFDDPLAELFAVHTYSQPPARCKCPEPGIGDQSSELKLFFKKKWLTADDDFSEDISMYIIQFYIYILFYIMDISYTNHDRHRVLHRLQKPNSLQAARALGRGPWSPSSPWSPTEISVTSKTRDLQIFPNQCLGKGEQMNTTQTWQKTFER